MFESEGQMSPFEYTGLETSGENLRLLHISTVLFLARWLTWPTQALDQFSLVRKLSGYPTHLPQWAQIMHI